MPTARKFTYGHMNIGIIVAMDKELSLLLPKMGHTSRTTVNDTEFYTGRIGAHEVTAMKCGIGKVNAAVGALTLIENFHPALVVNTGVAGGTGHGASILDVVVASEVAYPDVWCGPGTVEGQAAGCPPRFAGAITPAMLADMGLDAQVRTGLIASGDIFVSRTQDIDRILNLYPDAIAVDMESAAIAQICHLKNVPFVAIRVISDTPGAADNISQYENFWTDAPEHTFAVMSRIVASV